MDKSVLSVKILEAAVTQWRAGCSLRTCGASREGHSGHPQPAGLSTHHIPG